MSIYWKKLFKLMIKYWLLMICMKENKLRERAAISSHTTQLLNHEKQSGISLKTEIKTSNKKEVPM
jgi:DNA-binding Xre family transcriptional regulator